MKNQVLKSALKAHWFGLCVILLLQIASIGVLLVVATYSSRMIADVTNSDIALAKNILLIIFFVTAIAYLLEGCVNIFSKYITNKMYNSAVKMVFAHMQKLSIQTTDNLPTGAMHNLVYNDTKKIFENFISIVSVVYFYFQALAIIIYIMVCNILIGTILFVGMVISILIGALGMKRIKKITHVNRRVISKYKSLVNECIVSEKDIKSLNLNANLYNALECQYDLKKRIKIKIGNTRNINFRLHQTFIAIVIFCIEIALAFIMRDYGILPAIAIFIFIYSYEVKNKLVKMLDLFNIYPEFKTSCEKIDEFFDESVYKVEKYGDRTLDNVKGKIEFKNVGFTYEYKYFERSDNFENMSIKEMIAKTSEKPHPVAISEQVLKDINFVIEPNTKVAFVGFSGSGKTTILNLITKLIDPTNGQVLIDDHDISTLSEQTLRSNIAMVSQNTYIFSGTIKDNLLLVKPDATDDEINTALSKAFLTDFISEQPNGIMTKVGENGVKLSGGQKQRLAIARAFLKDSKIVVFDESTSALDNVAQTYVQNSIDECKNKTVVIVAHRLSTIINVDKIYFLQNGVIVNSGTFDYLMNNDEAFKELFLTELA